MAVSKTPKLTTTSFAILGQLGLHPWPAYELTKDMQRNFHYFWPRAESRIYDELKRLVEHGLAEAESSFTGRRARTTYSITPAGRQALKDWLATPVSSGNSLESEALLRVFVGASGTPDDILATLERVIEESEALLATGVVIAHEFLEDRSAVQHLVHLRALVFDFLSSYAMMTAEWAERARAEVSTWSDLSPDDKSERALAAIQQKYATYPPALQTPIDVDRAS